MSKQELSTGISHEIINNLVLTGDMSKLTPAQQTQYYGEVCKSLNLNPLTQPFAIMVLNGKKILYARKDCTQQLSNNNKISTEIKQRQTQDSVYIVSVRATMPDGRFTDEDGVVAIASLKGLELANAMMKASTKAKRRAVLALCGLGMPDETEVEDDKPQTGHASKSRVEQIIEGQLEPEPVKAADPSKAEEPKKEPEEPKKATKTKQEPAKKSSKQEKTAWEEEDETKTVIGLIDNQTQGSEGEIICYKTATVEKDGKPALKHSFLIENKRYGTFDSEMAKKIIECIDNRRFVKFVYKERKSPKGAILNDIVKFSEAEAEKDVEV